MASSSVNQTSFRNLIAIIHSHLYQTLYEVLIMPIKNYVVVTFLLKSFTEGCVSMYKKTKKSLANHTHSTKWPFFPGLSCPSYQCLSDIYAGILSKSFVLLLDKNSFITCNLRRGIIRNEDDLSFFPSSYFLHCVLIAKALLSLYVSV